MASHLKRAAELGLAAVTVEGALIAPAELARIAATPSDKKSAADYGCPAGTTLKDEIARYFRIGQALWQGFSRIEAPTIEQTAEFARAQLEGVFGFGGLLGPIDRHKDAHRYRLAWEAKSGRVPVVCAAPANDDDGFKRALPEFGDGAGGPMSRRSATTLLQEWLNANDDALWGLVFVGDRLRLMRDNASLTRPAWIEADLGAIYRDEIFADFTALWLLIHASRFGAEGAATADCGMERWREAGLRAGTAVRDKLRGSVEDALVLLGQGFLDSNPDLRERLADGRLSISSWFEQLLRLVYRLIFLAVAEDRDLLHAPDAKSEAKQLYTENYGFSYLRDRSARRQGRDLHSDAYEGAKIVFDALVHGEKVLGLPALGGLFAPGLTPDLDDATLDNRSLLAAVFKLAWLIGANGRERINWRDMATEELGSVYEGLLELVPVVEGGETFAFAGGAGAKGNARKVSGSYYTPDSLVQALLDSALDPVLDRAEAEGGAEAILDLNIIDPACGSGHFLLGAARRIANRVAQLRHPDAPDYQAAMRDVVRRCVHGVDRNPMAVELAKVALWIEAIEPGKPLGFLDANIRCGDSLLGVFDLAALEEGIPDDAYKPLTGDDKATADFYKSRNKAECKGQGSFDWAGGGGSLPPARIAATLEDVLALPEDTVEQVEAKRKRFWAWADDPRRQNTKVACELYVAAFLVPKTGGPPANANMGLVPTTSDIRTKLAGGSVFGPREAAAVDAAAEARAFHWPLAFPDVMIARGGFDVVIGNPPWERIEVQEQEFFSASYPAIAGAQNAAKRRTMIEALEFDDPATFIGWRRALRAAAVEVSFYKGSGRFPLGSVGKINTYAVFADHFRQTVNRRGRAGMIVPNGLLTGFTYRAFLSHMLSTKTLASFFGFENEELLFPHITNKVKFGLLTISGPDSKIEQPWFTAHLRQPAQINDPERRYALTMAEVEEINPNTLNLPAFRWAKDAEITAAIHKSAPVLIRKTTQRCEENPWRVFLMTLFNMATDSGSFLDHEAIGPLIRERRGASATLSDGREVYPLYEGKMFWHFDHRYGTYEGQTVKQRNKGVLPRTSDQQHADPQYRIEPLYWVDANVTIEALGQWSSEEIFFSWRDVGPAERTFVATAIPKTALGDTAPVLITAEKGSLRVGLYALLSSLVVDYAARQKTNRMSFFVVEQLPFLSPATLRETPFWLGEPVHEWLSSRAIELYYTSEELRPLAVELGCHDRPFAWDPERRVNLQAEIDAAVMHLYGLNRDQAEWLLDSFSVLRKYEERDFDEFRTKKLVLRIYDQIAAARSKGETYRSPLFPSSGDDDVLAPGCRRRAEDRRQ